MQSYKAGRPYKRARKAYKPLNYRKGGYERLEQKFVDTGSTGSFIDNWIGGEMDPTAASLLCLNAIEQGDGESQRIGRKVTVTGIYIRGSVNLEPSAASSPGPGSERKVRIVLVQDKQTNGAQLNAEDVMANSAIIPENAFRNLQFDKRFKILGDKTISLNYTAGSYDGTNPGYSGMNKHFQFFIPMKMEVTFNATTRTVSAITDNSLHLVGVGSTVVNFDYVARLRFTG